MFRSLSLGMRTHSISLSLGLRARSPVRRIAKTVSRTQAELTLDRRWKLYVASPASSGIGYIRISQRHRIGLRQISVKSGIGSDDTAANGVRTEAPLIMAVASERTGLQSPHLITVRSTPAAGTTRFDGQQAKWRNTCSNRAAMSLIWKFARA